MFKDGKKEEGDPGREEEQEGESEIQDLREPKNSNYELPPPPAQGGPDRETGKWYL